MALYRPPAQPVAEPRTGRSAPPHAGLKAKPAPHVDVRAVWEVALAVLRSRGGTCKLDKLVPLLDAKHVKTIRADGKGAKSFFASKSCAHLFEVFLPPGDGPGNELLLDRASQAASTAAATAHVPSRRPRPHVPAVRTRRAAAAHAGLTELTAQICETHLTSSS